MGKEKADFIHSEDAKDKAIVALRKAKALETKLKGQLKTVILPDGTMVTSNKEDILNEYARYGKL